MNISLLDYSVIALYLIGIFVLAYYSGRSKRQAVTANDQYLASKSLTFTESICSIIATEVSALTFLGIPSFAFGKDFSFVQIYFGAIIGRLFIAFVMLPKIYNQELTVYSVMGKHGSLGGQKSVTAFYALNKFLAVGVRLFSGSILVAEFFSISIYIAVFLICVFTFFYTLIGGLKAVVRTDIIQMGLFISGGFIAHYLIPQVSEQPWTELMAIATAGSKTSFFDLNNFTPFFIGVMGGILFDMATHGVDQDFAQRLTANKSLKDAKHAIILSGFLSVAVGFLFLSIGALLWAHYQSTTAPQIANDKIFAHFITNYFPAGVKGLMVAGVLAATMSTLDSTINALSSCFHNDLFNRSTETKDLKRYFRTDTLIITSVLMVIAFVAAQSDGILLVGLKITSWTAGSLLALFFMTLVFKKAKLTTPVVFSAYIAGVSAVGVNTFILKWNWNFNVYLGFAAACLAAYLVNISLKKS